MAQSFSEGKASKYYLAIVRGFTKELECIDYPLKDLWDKMTDQKAIKDKPEKAAITEYRRLATVELSHAVGRYCTARYSLVKVAPLTGRNRQIRRHMKHIFHPVVGDTTYGDGKQNDFFRKNFNCRRLLLHAIGIEFINPHSEQPIHIQAPLDQTFGSIMEALQWDQVGLP
jgi:tRNA pseudouridine65 synthase